jgi:hypothetical protein
MGQSTMDIEQTALVPYGRTATGRALRFLLVAAAALALAACDKCSFPNWPQTSPQSETTSEPLSCHSDKPATQ